MPESNSRTAENVECLGAPLTRREIGQQPDVWRKVAANIEADRTHLNTFLAPILAKPDLRVILTGAGTSAFIGTVVAPELSRRLARRTDAIATTDLASNPRDYLVENVPTLLVSFARSGNSPESVAATRIVDQCLSGVRHLIFTCDPSGDLALHHQGRPDSYVCLMPPEANDQSFAMTSSFSSMLLSALLVFGHGPQPVEPLVAAANDIINIGWDSIDDIASRDYDRVVYLGSGPLLALARESALKLVEMTAGRVVSFYESALGFRHGPKAVLDDQTLAVVFVSSDEYTRKYDLDILAELRDALGPGRVIAVTPEGVFLADRPVVPTMGLEGVRDAFLANVYVVIAQILSLAFATRVGATPDNPFPDGSVNRLFAVEGVVEGRVRVRG